MSSVCHVHGKTWGLFTWVPEDGLDEIHPDDRKFASLNPFYGHVFKVLYSDDEYIALEGATGRFRVRPLRFRQIESSPFDFGEVVRISPANSPKEGLVKEIRWHFKEKRVCYFIEEKGKKVSRRYWAEDLQKAAE